MIGAAHPDRLLRKGGARAGDVLILTKPLGTGAARLGRAGKGGPDRPTSPRPIDQMRTLNRAASEVLVAHGVRAATDVTGFGLLGHGLEMARASGTRFVFEAAALPALDGALDLAAAGVETGGAAHNRRFVLPALTVPARVPRRAGHAGARPADLGRPAGRGAPGRPRRPRGGPRGRGVTALAHRPRDRRRTGGRASLDIVEIR